MGNEITIPEQTIQKNRFPNKVGSAVMEGEKRPGTEKSDSTRSDPFKLLSVSD
jgi:hypothetical protein